MLMGTTRRFVLKGLYLKPSLLLNIYFNICRCETMMGFCQLANIPCTTTALEEVSLLTGVRMFFLHQHRIKRVIRKPATL